MRLPVLGDHADAGPYRVARTAQTQHRPVAAADASRVGQVGVNDRAQRLGAPGPHEAGEPKDFASSHLEAHVAHGGAAPESLHPERDTRVGAVPRTARPASGAFGIGGALAHIAC